MKGPPIFNLLLNWGLELAERLKIYRLVLLFSTDKVPDNWIMLMTSQEWMTLLKDCKKQRTILLNTVGLGA